MTATGKGDKASIPVSSGERVPTSKKDSRKKIHVNTKKGLAINIQREGSKNAFFGCFENPGLGSLGETLSFFDSNRTRTH